VKSMTPNPAIIPPSKTEIISYARQVAYLRDPHKISVAVYNYFGHPLDMASIERILVKKYGGNLRFQTFQCGHARTLENSREYAQGLTKCKTCHPVKTAQTKAMPHTITGAPNDRAGMIDLAMRVKTVVLDIFDMPPDFRVLRGAKSVDAVEAIAAVCLVAKWQGVSWPELIKTGFMDRAKVAQVYRLRAEQMYKTEKPFQRLVDACVKQL
jgi:hypothetical protein